MKANIVFAFCVFVAITFSFFAACVDAHQPIIGRCNHDERQALANRLTKRDMNSQEQKYVNGNSTEVGPIRINAAYVLPERDMVGTVYMACNKENNEIAVNGKLYKCEKADLVDEKKRQTVDSLMKSVLSNVAQMINVNLVQGALTLNSGVYGFVQLGTEGKPLSFTNYDLLIYVTYRPDSWDVYATGTSLAYDQNGRTIFGVLNWNPRNINSPTTILQNAALHEIFHILGFSQSRMMAFHNISTYDNTTGVSEEYSDLQLVGSESDGREITLLVSPKVKERFREHFGCDSAEGALLEDQGGSNVAGSHWEMTVLMDELMTATISERSILTNMTLAALEDSGWYYVNYSFAKRLLWGKDKGCDFVTKRCNSGWPVGEGYFCPYDKRGVEGCTYDRKGIGACDFRYWISIPEKYRYFEDNHTGGPVEYADFCPFTYGTFYCEESTTETTTYGDASGADSRCFLSTLTDSPDETTKQPEAPKCYPHYCITSDSYAVKIGNYWYPCPSGGTISDAIGFSGTLKCVNASMFCYEKEGTDRFFPIFVSIEPKVAKPGDSVLITGKNIGRTATVTLGIPCEDPKADAEKNTINCTLSAKSANTATAGPKNLIIKQNGYYIAVPNAFTLELGKLNWVKKNWFLVACIAISGAVLLFTILLVIINCCTTSHKWHKYQESQARAGQNRQKGNEFGRDVEFESVV